MNAATLINELTKKGVRLSRNGERLHVEARRGTVTMDMRDRLIAHKWELLALVDRARHLEAPQRSVLHFRLATFATNAWATVIGFGGVDALANQLSQRFGDSLVETRCPQDPYRRE